MRWASALWLVASCGEPRVPVETLPAPAQVAQSPAQAPVVPNVKEGRKLRVATYNILAAKRGLEEVKEALRRVDADVVALQEVDRNTRRFGRVDQPTVLGDALGMQHAFVRHRKYQGGEIGVALLSKFPIVDVVRIATRGSRLGSLSAALEIGDAIVQVLVVHFHPTNPLLGARHVAESSALRLREAKRAFATTSSEAWQLIFGDFNAQPGGPEYGLFASNFTDACRDGDPTWPAEFPLVRIDYIWHSAQLKPLRCQTVDSAASDHRPIVAEFVLSG